MKKFFCAVLAVLAMLLSACGGDMKGWPKLDLNLDIGSYDEVSLEYHHISSRSDRMLPDVDEDYFGTSSDEEVINDIYQRINGLPYSEEIYDEIDTENYRSKVAITFWKDGQAGYTFTFYGYSIKNGYFVFDNGEIHKYLGDFVSLTYENVKDKLNSSAF